MSLDGSTKVTTVKKECLPDAPARQPKTVKASIFEQSSVRWPTLKGRDYKVPVVQWPYRTHFRIEDDENHICARVEVTPELAAQLLAYNPDNNRNLKHNAIEKYASMMTDGNWVYSPQGIAFADDGRLIDGQNRLHAVVRSGEAVPMRVSLGWDTEVMNAIDRGVVRNLMDALKVEEVSMTKIELATLRAAVRFGHDVHVHNKTSVPRWLELCKSHSQSLAAMDAWYSTKWCADLATAAVRAAVFHASLTHPADRLKEFVDTLIRVRPPAPGEGAPVLLNECLAGYYKKRNLTTHRLVYLRTARAILLFLSKREVEEIHAPTASPFPAFTSVG